MGKYKLAVNRVFEKFIKAKNSVFKRQVIQKMITADGLRLETGGQNKSADFDISLKGNLVHADIVKRFDLNDLDRNTSRLLRTQKRISPGQVDGFRY